MSCTNVVDGALFQTFLEGSHGVAGVARTSYVKILLKNLVKLKCCILFHYCTPGQSLH